MSCRPNRLLDRNLCQGCADCIHRCYSRCTAESGKLRGDNLILFSSYTWVNVCSRSIFTSEKSEYWIVIESLVKKAAAGSVASLMLWGSSVAPSMLAQWVNLIHFNDWSLWRRSGWIRPQGKKKLQLWALLVHWSEKMHNQWQLTPEFRLLFYLVLYPTEYSKKKGQKELIEGSQLSDLSLLTVPPLSVGCYWASGAVRLFLIGSRTVGRYLNLLPCGYGMMEGEGKNREIVKKVSMRREKEEHN